MNKFLLLFLLLFSSGWSMILHRTYRPPFPLPKETLHYIFKTMDAITCEPVQIKKEGQNWNQEADEIDKALESAFAERGICSVARYEDYDCFVCFGFLQTKVTFTEKIALIEMQLVDETILLVGHASGADIIWNEKVLIDIESTSNLKETILSHIKMLSGQLVDAYLDARKSRKPDAEYE